MFYTMHVLLPGATRLARSGHSGPGPSGEVRAIRDIVNFVNFTSIDGGRFAVGLAG
jgi:hypothetical protein